VMSGASRDVARHREWMTRSFAMTATAITFRSYHVALFALGVAAETNYLVSLWLSILGNAAAAEWVLRRQPRFHAVPSTIPLTP